MLFRKILVDCVNLRDDEPNCSKEPKTRTEIYKPDLEAVEAIPISVDRLELGIETISGCENESLVGGHGDDDRLRKQNLQRAFPGLDHFGAEGPTIFTFIIIISSFSLLEFLLAFGEENRDICLFQK